VLVLARLEHVLFGKDNTGLIHVREYIKPPRVHDSPGKDSERDRGVHDSGSHDSKVGRFLVG
jgi:hypothetical protein